MPVDHYDVQSFWEKVLSSIGAAVVFFLGRKVLKGIKFAYSYYQERKDLKVTFIAGYKQLFWTVIIIIILLIGYLFLEVSSVRTTVKDIIGNAETIKEQNIHFRNIDTNMLFLRNSYDTLRKDVDTLKQLRRSK